MSFARLKELVEEELELHRAINGEIASYYQGRSTESVNRIMSLRIKVSTLLVQQEEVFKAFMTHESFKEQFPHYISFVLNNINWGSTLSDHCKIQILLSIFKLHQLESGQTLFNELKTKLGKKKIDVVATSEKTMSTHNLILYFPKMRQANDVYITLGKFKQRPLIATIRFISIGHEFIHMLHNLQDQSQQTLTTQDIDLTPRKSLYQENSKTKSGEEFHTIERSCGGSVTENDLRKEAELSLRGGWQTAQLTIENNPRLDWLLKASKTALQGRYLTNDEQHTQQYNSTLSVPQLPNSPAAKAS